MPRKVSAPTFESEAAMCAAFIGALPILADKDDWMPRPPAAKATQMTLPGVGR